MTGWQLVWPQGINIFRQLGSFSIFVGGLVLGRLLVGVGVVLGRVLFLRVFVLRSICLLLCCVFGRVRVVGFLAIRVFG